MKKILLVYTGGTICTTFDGEKRSLDTQLAKSVLLENFSKSDSPYAKNANELFEDSDFPKEYQTLSENMTIEKLNNIYKHLTSFPLENYSGVMIMHGTDSLHFSANLFSYLFEGTPVPILFISGNRPPLDKKSNANENFRYGAELLLNGNLPAEIFVPYQNSDGKMYLHKGSTLLPCYNFSEDFYNAKNENVFFGNHLPIKIANKERKSLSYINLISDSVLLIYPYPGLNYEEIPLNRIKAVIHGTYHSGTVCIHPEGKNSLITFAKRCKKKNIPLFVSPSSLISDQYETVFSLCEKANVTLLDLPTHSAYAKAIACISKKLEGEDLISYMQKN